MSMFRRLGMVNFGRAAAGGGVVTNLTVVSDFLQEGNNYPFCGSDVYGYGNLLGGSRSPTSIGGFTISGFSSSIGYTSNGIDGCDLSGEEETTFSVTGDPGSSWLTKIQITNSTFTTNGAEYTPTSSTSFNGNRSWYFDSLILMQAVTTFYFRIYTAS